MNRKTLLTAGMVCVVLCLALVLLVEEASAAASTSGADKGMATKKGVGQSLGSKEIEEDKLPGKLEMGLAVGSIIALIAVIKWL